MSINYKPELLYNLIVVIPYYVILYELAVVLFFLNNFLSAF